LNYTINPIIWFVKVVKTWRLKKTEVPHESKILQSDLIKNALMW